MAKAEDTLLEDEKVEDPNGEPEGSTKDLEDDAREPDPDADDDRDAEEDLDGDDDDDLDAGQDDDEEVDDDLLDRAAQAGIKPSEAYRYGRQKLEAALEVLENNRANSGRQRDGDPKGDRKKERFKSKLSKDRYDDDLIEEVERIASMAEERLETLETQVAEVRALRVQDEVRRIANRFNNWCNSSKEYGDLFGKKNAKELPKGSKELEAREKAWLKVTNIIQDRIRSGESLDDLTDIFDMGTHLAFKNHSQGKSRRDILRQVRRRSRGATGRPTNTGAPKGERNRPNNGKLAQKMREYGMSVTD